MLGQLEYLPAIHPLAFEHGRSVVEAMGQYVHLRLPPRHELAVQPDPTVTIIEGNERHREFSALQEVPLTALRARHVKQNGSGL